MNILVYLQHVFLQAVPVLYLIAHAFTDTMPQHLIDEFRRLTVGDLM